MNDKNQNLLTKFFRKVTRVFSKKTSSCKAQKNKLNGRMSEMIDSTAEILNQLTEIKEWLKKFSEPKIYSLGINIIDPMIAEISRFQKRIEQLTTSTVSQVKTVSKSVDWFEKTKDLIELKENDASHEEIEKFIILHTVESFQSLITKDIQLIQDYLNQRKDRKRSGIIFEDVPKLNSAISKISSLQEASNILTLDQLTKWKAKSDSKRERFLSEALHAIDIHFN